MLFSPEPTDDLGDNVVGVCTPLNMGLRGVGVVFPGHHGCVASIGVWCRFPGTANLWYLVAGCGLVGGLGLGSVGLVVLSLLDTSLRCVLRKRSLWLDLAVGWVAPVHHKLVLHLLVWCGCGSGRSG